MDYEKLVCVWLSSLHCMKMCAFLRKNDGTPCRKFDAKILTLSPIPYSAFAICILHRRLYRLWANASADCICVRHFLKAILKAIFNFPSQCARASWGNWENWSTWLTNNSTYVFANSYKVKVSTGRGVKSCQNRPSVVYYVLQHGVDFLLHFPCPWRELHVVDSCHQCLCLS